MSNLEVAVIRRTRLRPSWICALTVVLAAGCTGTTLGLGGSVRGPETHDRTTFDFTGDRLDIDSDSDVTVQPGGAAGTVVADRWVRPDQQRGAATWSMKNGTLTLRAPCQKKGGCSVRHTLRVPADVTLSIENSNGDTTVKRMSGELELEAENGDCTLQDIGKVATVECENGDVHITTSTPPDRLDVTADNGDVDVDLPDQTYRLRMEAGAGDKQSTVAKDPKSSHIVTLRADSGDITAH